LFYPIFEQVILQELEHILYEIELDQALREILTKKMHCVFTVIVESISICNVDGDV
jgi:hypothetical protein